jgi:predicted dehydrogenase
MRCATGVSGEAGGTMKRRDFISTIAGAAAAVSGQTAVSAGRVVAANERVNVGLIGCGSRGRLVSKLMREVPNVDFIAVCDVYDAPLQQARDWAGPRAQAFRDFRKVLDLKDVDAVVIATPDHWHAIPAVLACQAGKDIYLEKPLGYTVREGRAIVEAVQRHGRILLHGTQQRSAPHYAEAARIVRSGALGPVHFVRIWNYVNMHPEGIGRAADSEPPPGADWDFFLGPAPSVPFNRNRFVGTYRWFWDYGGGLVTDFGIHRFDSMHQIMGVDAPVSAVASGRRFALTDGAETPDVVQVTYDYPGFVLSYEAMMLNAHGAGGRSPGRTYYGARGETDRPHGEAYYGTNGTLIVDRLGFEIFPELKTTSGPGAVGRDAPVMEHRMRRAEMTAQDATAAHVGHFVDCVRSRQKPNADAETGQRSSTVSHLGNIALRTGRKIAWDAKSETIVNDGDAAKLLSRQPRKPWDLIAVS